MESATAREKRGSKISRRWIHAGIRVVAKAREREEVIVGAIQRERERESEEGREREKEEERERERDARRNQHHSLLVLNTRSRNRFARLEHVLYSWAQRARMGTTQRLALSRFLMRRQCRTKSRVFVLVWSLVVRRLEVRVPDTHAHAHAHIHVHTYTYTSHTHTRKHTYTHTHTQDIVFLIHTFGVL